MQSGDDGFSTSSLVVIWDETLSDPISFNDLGFAGDWYTSGNIGPLSGEYLITCYVQLHGDSAFTGGTARISILDGVGVESKRTFPLAVGDFDPELGFSDVRRYILGAVVFSIQVSLENPLGPSTITITEGSLTITKQR